MNGLYIAASGAAGELATLNTVAQNLANADTPGYRRFHQLIEAVADNTPWQYAGSAITTRIDTGQGPLRVTGNPLDIAVVGPAFLAVETPQGRAFTRDGALQLTADGTLLAAGQPLLGASGAPLKLPAGQVTIAADGSISVNGRPAAQLMLADPGDTVMNPLGGNLYQPDDPDSVAPALPGSSVVRQGYLEFPAGNTVADLTSLMSVTRSYESAMRSVQSIDDDQNRTIQAFTLQA
ncbi:MAG TPA: flagellar hook basal-body protein [Candidatus Binataceae bacterium]|nr:flagellar hook basal-body protein [Candidatus Binataceae bacterium]